MKYPSIFFILLFAANILAQSFSSTSILSKDSIYSSLDKNKQVFYYSESKSGKLMPLVVQLHSWSYNADSLKTLGLDSVCISKNYNYLFPDFRGKNNHVKACGSEFVVNDIDEAIDWALANLPVDKSKIYLVGYSGGGFLLE